MNLRLCDKLNEKFIPRKPHQSVYTHQSAIAWSFIEKSLLYLAKDSSAPKQIYVHICCEGTKSAITLSNGFKETFDLTLQGVKGIVSRAKSEGLKVESNLSNNEFTFFFTPSNY